MTDAFIIRPPLTNDVIEKLRAGDQVLITGVLLTARDRVHQALVAAKNCGEQLPTDLAGQLLYYTGPTPTPPEKSIGSAGPASSYALDIYTPILLQYGLKGMIGKGPRSEVVKDALRKHKAVYFAAIGGAGSLIAKTIKHAEIVGYPELGPEAMMRLEVEQFPAIVANDIYGGDLYRIGVEQYRHVGDEPADK
ncbi:MAG: FumA C-terminus/TtdB family hydratase beta subunit [Nitrospirota bacterium]